MIKGLDHLSPEERQRDVKLFHLENRFINLCKYMILGNKQPMVSGIQWKKRWQYVHA